MSIQLKGQFSTYVNPTDKTNPQYVTYPHNLVGTNTGDLFKQIELEKDNTFVVTGVEFKVLKAKEPRVLGYRVDNGIQVDRMPTHAPIPEYGDLFLTIQVV